MRHSSKHGAGASNNNTSRRSFAGRGVRYSVGIDEVGRGSLAGPVVVAAVCIPSRIKLKLPSRIFANAVSSRTIRENTLRDSKRLSAQQRERWSAYCRSHPSIAYAVARVYPRGIEKMNISVAANLAALRAFIRLAKSLKLKAKSYCVYLDGGLYLGNTRSGYRAHTVVKGDEKIPAIAAASIIAKVHRDRYMRRLAKQYPQYGFEMHKGYGTKVHFAAIRRHGPSEVHRATFLKNISILKS